MICYLFKPPEYADLLLRNMHNESGWRFKCYIWFHWCMQETEKDLYTLFKKIQCLIQHDVLSHIQLENLYILVVIDLPWYSWYIAELALNINSSFQSLLFLEWRNAQICIISVVVEIESNPIIWSSRHRHKIEPHSLVHEQFAYVLPCGKSINTYCTI